jgi:outer membrane protein OmpA-like peptidoglycan-associated protein
MKEASMNAKLTTVLAVVALVVSTSEARAQTAQPEEGGGFFNHHLDAPSQAFEMYMRTGYTQGFGSLYQGADLNHVIGPGFALDFGLAYRIDPHWSIGATGQYQEFEAERTQSARGMVAGFAGAYHFTPYKRADPWVQLGSGYRFLWENTVDGLSNTLTHGFELGRIDFGVDIRIHRDVSVAPVLSAGLTLPLWYRVGDGTNTAIPDPRVSTFLYAGIQGRFDIAAKHESGRRVAQTQITQANVPPPTKRVSPSIDDSEDVRAACNLELDNVDKAPKFDFDKSELLPADYEVLQKIAICFTTGPFKDDNINLVGRADPRGSEKYNEALGQRRATSVATYLEKAGIAATRIEKSSRGKMDATGTDEATWAVDRRVDILLR